MRELSSRWTWFFKVPFPAAWMALFALLTALVFLSPGRVTGAHPDVLRWGLLAATLAGSCFLHQFCLGLTRVRLLGDTLLISDFRHHVRVPLREVERVSGGLLPTPEFLWLHFRTPIRFGRRVVFMPPRRRFGLSRHPLARELQALIEGAAQRG